MRGLDNPSNCCFVNAPMQCLSHTYPAMVSFVSGMRLPAGLSEQDTQMHQIAIRFAELAMSITVDQLAEGAQPTVEFRQALAAQVMASPAGGR